MNKAALPTFLGIAVILVGVIFGYLIVENLHFLKLGASADISPKNVHVSNQTENSLTISWTTNTKTQGAVLWGKDESMLAKRVSEDDSASWIHMINLNDLESGTNYFFKIESSGKVFSQGAQPWEAHTGKELSAPSTPSIIAGTILTDSGTPASNVLVHATVDSSSLLTTRTAKNGAWIIPLGYARNKDLSSHLIINEESSLVEISVFAGPLGAASAKVYPTSAKPAPPITLGKAHDYTELKSINSSQIPEADLNTPKDSTAASEFDISDNSEIESESN